MYSYTLIRWLVKLDCSGGLECCQRGSNAHAQGMDDLWAVQLPCTASVFPDSPA